MIAERVSRSDRGAMRRAIFVADDGIVLALTLAALDEVGILERSLEDDSCLRDLHPELSASGFGYLRAGLRTLASHGWLAPELGMDPADTFVRWTVSGRHALSHRGDYVAAGRFLASFGASSPDLWQRPWTPDQEERFLSLLALCLARWRLEDALPVETRATISSHLDAALTAPVLLWLHGSGLLEERGPLLPGDDVGEGMRRLLSLRGCLDATGDWTETGRHAREYAIHFGMVGSYFPTLARLPELYRGGLVVAPAEQGLAEWHVNRELNLAASTAAHRRYFEEADDIFLELFDREPVEAQPRFIADMGCGDGRWLIHLHGLIRERTLRGRHLDSHPIALVGIDIGATALESARRELAAAGVPGLLLFGDISDPDSLRSALEQNGLAIEDGLHIRSFIDHNRPYAGGDPGLPVAGRSSGVYVDAAGLPLDAADVERDLVAHLMRWAPHVRRHGLVVVEAHCVSPTVARRHLGSLHSVAFDAYHAYSHQYLVEYSTFVDCCRLAGLERIGRHERHYPSSRPFVAVSLNRLVPSEPDVALPATAAAAQVAREDTWRPEPGIDLEDGVALHRVLFDAGDLCHPRAWSAAATGFVVGAAVAAIEARLRGARAGDVIRVLDYGTGTGLATIELLKACQELRLEERLEQRGASLELHLVDLPSSWFAHGYALLSDCAWTRFHSLRDANGDFRPLAEVLGARAMDVAIVSMVFHLIPPSALGRVVAELASVLRPGGRLVWSSPDIGPPGPDAVLLHDPNRALRARWLEREGPKLDPATLRMAEERAAQRILPTAHTVDDLVGSLRVHFDGESERRTYEMTDEEIVDALLIPANQREYLSEIADRATRERAIRELMLEEVLPAMRATTAGTARGLNVQWSLGDFELARPAAAPSEAVA